MDADVRAGRSVVLPADAGVFRITAMPIRERCRPPRRRGGVPPLRSGRYAEPKSSPPFGALTGAHTQPGMNITIGRARDRPPLQINSHTMIGPSDVIPDHHVLSPTEPPAHRAHPRPKTRI